MPACARHAEIRAEYRCKGCRAFLCEECIEEGHRLLFCRICRELAVPLDAEAPSSTPALERARKLGRPYGLADAFLYPFRGLGAYQLPALALWLGAGIFLGGLADFILRAALLLILPGILFEIVRTSAEGEDQLPDWPDASEPFARFAEIGRWTLVAVVALAPAWLALRATGCDLEPYLWTHPRGVCLLFAFGGFAVGFLLGVFALGATAVHDSTWLVLRADLHLEALFGPAGGDGVGTALLVAALLAAARLLDVALRFLPIVGAALSALVTVYALFLGAHLVGRLFLRHRRTLDPLYRD